MNKLRVKTNRELLKTLRAVHGLNGLTEIKALAKEQSFLQGKDGYFIEMDGATLASEEVDALENEINTWPLGLSSYSELPLVQEWQSLSKTKEEEETEHGTAKE